MKKTGLSIKEKRIHFKNSPTRLPVAKTQCNNMDSSPMKRANVSVLNDLLKDPEAGNYIGPDGQNLIKTLENVRRRGYALNDGEIVKRVRLIAAPIFNAPCDIEAVINIPVFGHRVSRKELVTRSLPMLLDTAENISAPEGFAHPKRKYFGKQIVRDNSEIRQCYTALGHVKVIKEERRIL